jgi:hypothetical protein
MSSEQAISLYLQLTRDIHAYWGAVGALTVLILGWLLSRKTTLRFSQRVALTIGWFAASSYLGSSLMNRYRLVAALAQDVPRLKSETNVLKVIADLGPLYQHYETIVWTSFGAISIGALVSNLDKYRSPTSATECRLTLRWAAKGEREEA